MAHVERDRGHPSELAPENTQESKQGERKERTRTGCLNFSRRRRKCDEEKPICTGCKRRGDKCQWRMLGSFRDANLKVLESDHPSMSQGVAASCWTNALQPLWVAGKVMSHYSEHEAIVETLSRIERETGWATAWRVEDLKDFWGDYGNDDD